MFREARSVYASALAAIASGGFQKNERVLTSPQGAAIHVEGRAEAVLNFCSNNYLGLSADAEVVAAAQEALVHYGFGLSSVRFICGTQDAHRRLERELAAFLGAEDAILYSSCFDANGGLFEALLDENDAVLSDSLNHASIIDGIRLCRAERRRYPHADMWALEEGLKETARKRVRMIATDGVFSMDGEVAPLDAVCELADRHGAVVMVDDSHATGFIGPSGRGTPEHYGLVDRVDLVTSTLGKALGGACGGFTAGRREMVATLRQKSRPYLFSNTLAPAIVGASLAVLARIGAATELREAVMRNTRRFREGVARAGFTTKGDFHPIVPVMMAGPRAAQGRDASLAREVAEALLDEGIYVVAFAFPVVPLGQARIRVQLSASHTAEMVDAAVEAFTRVGKRFDLIGYASI